MGPPGSGVAPSDLKRSSIPLPATTATTPHVAVGTASRSKRSWTCSCMSATSRRETAPIPANSVVARSGSSVWTCTFSVRWSPTTSTESPIDSSVSTHVEGSRPSPVTAKFVQ